MLEAEAVPHSCIPLVQIGTDIALYIRTCYLWRVLYLIDPDWFVYCFVFENFVACW
jgi:hypothetical protein